MTANSKSPFFTFFYGIALFIVAVCFLPRLFFKAKSKTGRAALYQKMGFGIPKNSNAIGAFWFHAVSLGETKAIAPLVEQVRKSYPHIPYIVTTTTDTGFKEAEKLFPDATRFYLPWDFKFLIRPLVQFYLPKMIILSETDLWLNFLQAGIEVKAKTAVVSAKISDRSLGRLKRFPLFAKKLFGALDKVLVQNDTYEKRFLSLGIPPEKVKITGNLKFDIKFPAYTSEELAETRNKLGLKEGEKLVVLASTHAPEEMWLLDKLYSLPAKIALVPRHPYRFEEVAKLMPEARRFSNPQETASNWILVDAMGQLLKIFALADVAVVCGSFNDKIGGHNLLEPCAYKVPTLFGPYVQTQFEMEQLILSHQAGMKVTLDELLPALNDLLEHKEKRDRLGENGLKLISQLQGIGKKTWEALLSR